MAIDVHIKTVNRKVTANMSVEQIDAVLLTKNSDFMLEKCLTALYKNAPVKTLIVVDGCSTDKTLEILKKFRLKGRSIWIFQSHGTRAKAREIGISKVSTEWFLFIDSDAVLCKDWFRRAQKELAGGVGAVWGLNVDVIPNVKDKRIIRLQSALAQQCFALRGGTHDTLILTKTVKDLKIPQRLHVFEDTFLIKQIQKQGCKVVIGEDIYCLHYKPPTNWDIQNSILQAVTEFRCGLLYSHMYRYSVFYVIFFFYWLLQSAISLPKNVGYLLKAIHK